MVLVEWTGMAQGGGGWVPCSQVWGWLCLVCGLVLQPALTGSCLQWGLGLPCSRWCTSFTDPLHSLERTDTALTLRLGCSGVQKIPSQAGQE